MGEQRPQGEDTESQTDNEYPQSADKDPAGPAAEAGELVKIEEDNKRIVAEGQKELEEIMEEADQKARVAEAKKELDDIMNEAEKKARKPKSYAEQMIEKTNEDMLKRRVIVDSHIAELQRIGIKNKKGEAITQEERDFLEKTSTADKAPYRK